MFIREVMEKALEMPVPGAVLDICIHQVRCAYAQTQRVRRLAIFCWGTVFMKEESAQSQIEAATVFVEESSCQRAFRCTLGSRD
jgi:hypothetical protein